MNIYDIYEYIYKDPLFWPIQPMFFLYQEPLDECRRGHVMRKPNSSLPTLGKAPALLGANRDLLNDWTLGKGPGNPKARIIQLSSTYFFECRVNSEGNYRILGGVFKITYDRKSVSFRRIPW